MEEILCVAASLVYLDAECVREEEGDSDAELADEDRLPHRVFRVGLLAEVLCVGSGDDRFVEGGEGTKDCEHRGHSEPV